MQNRKKIVKRILKESIDTLKLLLKNVDGNKMPITSMEVYMVDPDGDGIYVGVATMLENTTFEYKYLSLIHI